MAFRSIAAWLKDPWPRRCATALCAMVVLVGSGLPCACVCVAHEAGAAAHDSRLNDPHADGDCSDADHGEGQDHCPSPSICSADQVPATVIETAWHGPMIEQLSAWHFNIADHSSPLGLASAAPMTTAARSSPVPPIFAILRL
jgi:hypothetical protein